MHVLNTSAGPLETANPWLNRSIASEVIEHDCYHLRELARVWAPLNLFDVGCGHGQVSMLARKLWPSVQITGFEADPYVASLAVKNVPGAMVHTGYVGYGVRAAEIVQRYGYADLLVIDCEGGEVPFFYDLHAIGVLQNFRVILGEWHFWPARRCLEECFRGKYRVRFGDPVAGAGPWSYFAAVHESMPEALAGALGVA